MTSDLFWIVGPWRGRLAIAARPRGGDWLQDEVSGWRRASIDVVVSLLESDEADELDLVDESKVAGANGIQFISFPIPDRSVPASVPASLMLIANVSSALDEGKNAAVQAGHQNCQRRPRARRPGDARSATVGRAIALQNTACVSLSLPLASATWPFALGFH